MDFGAVRTLRTRQSFGGSAANRRQHTKLSMYDVPPTDEINLTEFEKMALERLQVLRLIETLRAKKASGDSFSEPLRLAINKHDLNNPRTDHYSHFILRLAYCKSEELRRWFVTQESELFRHRFGGADEKEVADFFKEAKLRYEMIPKEQFDADLRAKLSQVPFSNTITDNAYYMVPFEEALDLVKQRAVYLSGGLAYVPRRDLVSIVQARFRINLSKHLAFTYRSTQGEVVESRVRPLLKSLASQSVGPTYKVSFNGHVTKEQIPLLADRSFPLCMEHLYKELKARHKLKHGGRMQLGLFLKGIGLSLDEALEFWRSSFARTTNPEAFNKQYAYNIRHNYGKEGKRQQYTPYGCVKIIQSHPGAEDHHGCPFRHLDEGRLRMKLREHKVSNDVISDITGLVKNSHYQIACQRYFSATHGNTLPETVGNHPNAYFDASLKYYNDIAEKANGGSTESKQATDPSASSSSSTTPATSGPEAGTASSSATSSSSTPTPMNEETTA